MSSVAVRLQLSEKDAKQTILTHLELIKLRGKNKFTQRSLQVMAWMYGANLGGPVSYNIIPCSEYMKEIGYPIMAVYTERGERYLFWSTDVSELDPENVKYDEDLESFIVGEKL
jgi:hypothetical protein